MMRIVKDIPELRFPGFENEWFEMKTIHVFTIFNGYAFSSNDAIDSGCRWIKIADVGINFINNESPSYLPESYLYKFPKFVLRQGDYVVALTRPILNSKLKIARIDKTSDESLLNQRVGKLVSNNNLDFIYQLLQKRELILKIDNRIAGSDPPNLSPNEINSIQLKIPSLPEQQKIASFLSAADQRLQLLTQKKEKLEQYKKGIMQQIFSQQVRFKDENGHDYPEWEEKRLGEIFEIVGGGTPETSNLDYWNGEIPWFTPSEIKSKYAYNSERSITEKGLRNSSAKTLPIGSLLFTSRATIGDMSISKINCTTNQGFQSFLPHHDFSTEFSYYYFNQHKKEFLRRSSGSTFLEISKSEIQKIKLFFPTIPEQQKIASFLSSIDQKTTLVNQQIELTRKWKQGLLQKMFV